MSKRETVSEATLRMKTPPHSLEAERGVLGSILLDAGNDNHVLDLCIENGLTAESFFAPHNQTIFNALTEMSRASAAIDPLTLNDKLRSADKLDEIGGSMYIQQIIDDTPTSAHAEYYIGIVRQKHLLRSVITCARKAEQRCHEEAASAEMIVGEVEQSLLNVCSTNRVLNGGTIDALLDERVKFYKEALARGYGGLLTGHDWIDQSFGGLSKGRVYIVSGGAGCGKTTLVRSVISDLAIRGIPTAIATLEIPASELAAWMVCGLGGISMKDLDLGNNQKAVESFERHAAEFRKLPISIEGGPMTPSMFQSWVRRQVKKGVQLVGLDYMQLLKSESDGDENEERRVSKASITVLETALMMQVPILAICSESNEGRLRHSGQLSYDCAGHIKLTKRDDGSGPTAEFKKCRHGAQTEGGLELYFSKGRLSVTPPDMFR